MVDNLTRLLLSGPAPEELPPNVIEIVEEGDPHALESFLRKGCYSIDAKLLLVGGSLLGCASHRLLRRRRRSREVRA